MASSVTQKAMFSAVTTLVVFGAAEMGLAAAGWPQADGKFTHSNVYWLSDPGLKNEAMPHKEVRGSFKVTTDQNGLRYPIHDVDKRPDTWRIMTLGCSTTFGWGVDDPDSYPAKLEVLARASGHANTEVINGGQPGYTSFQGLWLWDDTLKYYDPDVVLIGYVVQDSRKAAYSDKSQAILQRNSDFLKANLLHRSRIYLGLRTIIGGIQIEAKEVGPNDTGGVYRMPPEDYVANLRKLVANVQDVGGQPVLFSYPLEREGYMAQHRRILEAAAEELDVPYLDPQPKMEQASRQAELYFPRDRGHANAAGNALIAEWVHAWLAEQDLLGPTR